VVGLNLVVGVPIGTMPGGWQQLVQDDRVGRRDAAIVGPGESVHEAV
jgi:hypothetical protein